MMSACASACMCSKAVANCSSSSSDADPSSLQGARCSASSITPSATLHDRALPPGPLASSVSHFLSRTFVSLVVLGTSPLQLHRLLHTVHVLDLILHPRRYHVPFQLSIHRQRPILNGECFRQHTKRPHQIG